MGSFAFYSDKGDSPLEVDVHFNLWNQCGWKNDLTYLDVGVMIHRLENERRLYINFPFKFESTDILDLNDALKEIETLNAIFNESYYSKIRPNSKWIDILSGDTKVFGIYLLDSSKDKNICVKHEDGSTIIELKIPIESVTDKIYIRFRVKIPQETPIIRTYDRPYKWVRGIFQQSYVIDFRYNDKRSFSKTILENIGLKFQWVRTKKVHFLLISKASVHVECSDSVKKRMLEGDVWANYLKDKTNNAELPSADGLIAYHAKEASNEGDIASWEFFAKQDVEISKKSNLLLFFIFTVIISIAYGIIGNAVYDWIVN